MVMMMNLCPNRGCTPVLQPAVSCIRSFSFVLVLTRLDYGNGTLAGVARLACSLY